MWKIVTEIVSIARSSLLAKTQIDQIGIRFKTYQQANLQK